jgi:uncharacterized SAM-binding protein YcdF (DUF218 family)
VGETGLFYVLSKLFWFVADPQALGVLLVVLAALLALLGRRRLSLAALLPGGLILVLISFTTLGAVLFAPLEERFSRPPAPPSVDGIVLLGGGLDVDVSTATGTYAFNEAGDRYIEALRLARLYPTARILISGGVGALGGSGDGDATAGARFFTDMGIDPDRLILEPNSRNTAENAAFSKPLADPQPGQTWLLVTSAFHMPRSVGVFRKVGFPVVPWPTDYRSPGRDHFALDMVMPSANAVLADTAVREWIGLLAYRVAGYTDQIFPAP